MGGSYSIGPPAGEGHEQADLYAKEGAKLWGIPQERKLAAEGAHHLAKMTAKWLGTSTAWWQQQGEDTEGMPEEIELEEIPSLRKLQEEAEREEAQAR